MSLTGDNDEFVNAQFLTLTNVTDSEIYRQITNVAFDLNRLSHFKSRTDGRIDRLFGAGNNGIEFDITLTVPEVATFVDLSQMINLTSNRTLPSKQWRIDGTAEDGQTFSIAITGSVVQLRTIRPTAGASTHHIRIEAETITVSIT
jgi:hypothetical protein